MCWFLPCINMNQPACEPKWFTHLQMIGKKERKRITFHDTRKLYKIRSQCLPIKFYWDTALLIHFCVVEGCFLPRDCAVESLLRRMHVLQRVLTLWPFSKKSSVTLPSVTFLNHVMTLVHITFLFGFNWKSLTWMATHPGRSR